MNKEQLAMSNEETKLVFIGEVKSLEFTQMIGEMGCEHIINENERDKELVNIGKNLFKKQPVKKYLMTIKEKIKARVSRMLLGKVKVFSQEEIDNLLTGNK